MNKSIISRLKNFGITAGLAGFLLGCATGDPKVDTFSNFLGQVIVAQEGRSEVNVNTQGGRQRDYSNNNSQSRTGYSEDNKRQILLGKSGFKDATLGYCEMFTFNYFIDINNNGIIEERECKGLKKDFYETENISFLLRFFKPVNFDLFNVKLIGPDKERVICNKNRINNSEGLILECFEQFKSNELSAGNYTILVNRAGKERFAGIMYFNVFERK